MIRLEEINGKNVWDILKLKVGESQKEFVASNDVSIIEAYIAVTHHGKAFPFGIYDGDTPVGFCMIGFGADDDWEDAPAVAKDNYNLWRFMIDERYQGKGCGRAAMELILDYIGSEPCGPAECCWLSYEPENERAKALYASFGFRETGEFDGEEAIAVLKLQPGDVKDEIIEKYVNRSAEILKEKLTGIYLHGSAAMGCYQPKKSDLDFMVVVNKTLTDAEKREYMDMVLELDAEGPAKGIEMSIVTKDVCDPFVYPTPFILHYSRRHTEWYRTNPDDYIRKMNGTDKDLAAHFTVIRGRGICLYGQPVDEVFGEVPEKDYLDSIWDDVSGAGEEITDNPMYLILNLTRVLGYLKEKEVLSKQEGGTWGLKNLPGKYHPLILTALDEYENGAEVRYDPELARDYAAYMLRQITRGQMKGIRETPKEVERAVAGDEETVALLACELWPHHTLEEMKEEFKTHIADEEAAVFLYRKKDGAVGFAHCQLRHDYVEGTESSPVGYLEGIYVKETDRGEGIARKLLTACEDWAGEKGCAEFASDCEVTNTVSQHFHEAVGFEEANRLVAYVRKI